MMGLHTPLVQCLLGRTTATRDLATIHRAVLGVGLGVCATGTTCPAVQVHRLLKKQAVPAAVPYQVTKPEVLGHHLFQKKNKFHNFNDTNFACETCIHSVLTV